MLQGRSFRLVLASIRAYSNLQAVGPVAVTSLILGSNLPDAIDAPVQADPNNPVNQRAQDQYNKAAIEVWIPCHIDVAHRGIVYYCLLR